MEFKIFRDRVRSNLEKLAAQNLFKVNYSKEDIWECYLTSFPEGTNPVFRERGEYDCQSCKHFIVRYGGLVSIDPDTLEVKSIWDDIEGYSFFDVVARKMAEFVKSKAIREPFFTFSKKLGVHHNLAEIDGEVMEFNHFYAEVPERRYVKEKDNIPYIIAEILTRKDVLEKTLCGELSQESIEVVLDLINQNSLYRGEQYKHILEAFLSIMREYERLKEEKRENWLWLKAISIGGDIARIKNLAIGQLLKDITDGKDLEEAVTAYERIVAPQNYRRPKPIVTKSMIEQAERKLSELGLLDSLNRRVAVVSDLNIRDSLYVNRDVAKELNTSVFSQLKKELPENISPKTLERIKEVSINEFVESILPSIREIELYFDNKTAKNLVAMTTAVNPDSPTLFKWDNSFAWIYHGGYADASVIKEKVKKAGGNVEGELRISLHWFNLDDLDLHVGDPYNEHIYYSHKSSRSGGQLDVDMNVNYPIRGAVENIFWRRNPPEGRYIVYVYNFKKREFAAPGFEIEIEFRGERWKFEYCKDVGNNERIDVTEFTIKNGELKFDKKYIDMVEESYISKEVWGLTTNKFYKVKAMTLSPNYWGDNKVGQKHYLFFLEKCKPNDTLKAFLPEYLRGDIRQHAKLFEFLADRLKVEPIADGLYGVGFTMGKDQKTVLRILTKSGLKRLLKVKFGFNSF